MGQKVAKQSKDVSNKVSDKDRAVLELKSARDRMKKYRKKLDIETAKLTEQAKQLIKDDKKNRALLVLKLRKHKEVAAENVDGQLLTVMQMIEDLEWESMNMNVLAALKSGTAALNQLHNEMSVDQVAALLEETAEAIEVENQINALLVGQLTLDDEASLLEELVNLGTTHNDIVLQDPVILTLPKVPDAPVTPAVPSHEIIINDPNDDQTKNKNIQKSLLLS